MVLAEASDPPQSDIRVMTKPFSFKSFYLDPLSAVVQHLKWGQSRENWVNREYLKLEAVHFVWNQSFPFSKTPVALFIFSYLKTSNWKLVHYCRKNNKKLVLQISYLEKVFPNLKYFVASSVNLDGQMRPFWYKSNIDYLV